MFNFNEEAKKHEKEVGKLSTFHFKEGQNLIRIIDEPVKYMSEYKGNLSTKWVTHIIDRSDNEIKTLFMPFTIFKMLGDLQSNPDYGFETLPMPFDVTVTATKAGTKEVNYSMTPARNNTPLTEEELVKISSLRTNEEIVAALSKKQSQTQPEQPVEDYSQDEYPIPEEEEINIKNIPF